MAGFGDVDVGVSGASDSMRGPSFAVPEVGQSRRGTTTSTTPGRWGPSACGQGHAQDAVVAKCPTLAMLPALWGRIVHQLLRAGGPDKRYVSCAASGLEWQIDFHRASSSSTSRFRVRGYWYPVSQETPAQAQVHGLPHAATSVPHGTARGRPPLSHISNSTHDRTFKIPFTTSPSAI